MKELKCPMHQEPQPVLDEVGFCAVCGREWYETIYGLMSTSRRVSITTPLIEGADINECITALKSTGDV